MILSSYRRVDGDQLQGLWQQVPEQAQGYLITLKDLKWHQRKPQSLPEQSHEGRFFTKDQDLHWRRVQYFNGKDHVHGYDLVCIGFPGEAHQTLEVEQGEASTLILWDAPFKDLKAQVDTQAWNRDGMPVYHQWLCLDLEEEPHE